MDSGELLILLLVAVAVILVFALLSNNPQQRPNINTGSFPQNLAATANSVFGNAASSFASATNSSGWTSRIDDKYETVEDVQQALQAAGLESCNLIVGVDYTKSNESSGRRTFGGKSLHALSDANPNPYQQVISILGRTLEAFDEDKQIPVYGFGDITTKGTKVFPFYPDRSCNGFEEVLKRYNEVTPHIQLSGPTNFAPLIYEAINIVKQVKDFHVLVIIADGLVTSERETMDAIVEASKYPLAIVMVGVGDGPFDQMKDFDDNLPQRQFDNFQFVNFFEVINRSSHPESSFALHALMELPEQFKYIKKMKMV